MRDTLILDHSQPVGPQIKEKLSLKSTGITGEHLAKVTGESKWMINDVKAGADKAFFHAFCLVLQGIKKIKTGKHNHKLRFCGFHLDMWQELGPQFRLIRTCCKVSPDELSNLTGVSVEKILDNETDSYYTPLTTVFRILIELQKIKAKRHCMFYSNMGRRNQDYATK